MVDVIHVRMEKTHFVLEMNPVRSILTTREATDIPLLNPAQHFGLDPGPNPHVALMRRGDGELVAVVLGKYLGIERLEAQDVMVLPRWLATSQTSLLHDACVWHQDIGILWMLDTQAILKLPTRP